jgi:hypothetical protein
MPSGTENRKSGAGRTPDLIGGTTRFCGFHACARSLTAGGVRPRLNLQTKSAEGRPFSREGQSPDGRDFRLGEAKPSMARRARARHALSEANGQSSRVNDA